MLSFAGTVVLGPFIVPPFTGVSGSPLRLFGVAGELGRDNARRNPKRSAGTAAALMLSVTLITFIAVFTPSFGASINAAIDSTSGRLEVTGAGFGFPSLKPDLVDDLADGPEVAAVTGVQCGTCAIDGDLARCTGCASTVSTDLRPGRDRGRHLRPGPGPDRHRPSTAEQGPWDIGTALR